MMILFNKKLQPFRLLILAGLILGGGLGGFVDGILFHQILQLHNMLSNTIFPDTLVKAEINMFWDGLFHAFTFFMTVIGIALLWKYARTQADKSTPVLIGSILIGAGSFNLIEGLIDHHFLQIHHVLQRAAEPYQLIGDLSFLLSGILLIIAGALIIKKDLKNLV